jgi:hypothetical protein
MVTRSINRSRIGRQRGVALAVALVLCSSPAIAQSTLPFYAGEELTYRMQLGILGTIGGGTMSVEGPIDVRGTGTLLLHSSFRSNVIMVKGVDETRSWIDPERMRTLRFEKHERTPLSRQDEAVEVFGPERRWVDADGTTGRSASDLPLDELSFIYFIRTLDLVPGATLQFNRHFDQSRNPITVRVMGRERIRVGAGEFDALVVEMTVQDPARYRGEGIIRIHLSDGPCRLPLRIESRVPSMGKTVLTLESHTHPLSHFGSTGDIQHSQLARADVPSSAQNTMEHLEEE